VEKQVQKWEIGKWDYGGCWGQVLVRKQDKFYAVVVIWNCETGYPEETHKSDPCLEGGEETRKLFTSLEAAKEYAECLLQEYQKCEK